jgi:hypothetical protein
MCVSLHINLTACRRSMGALEKICSLTERMSVQRDFEVGCGVLFLVFSGSLSTAIGCISEKSHAGSGSRSRSRDFAYEAMPTLLCNVRFA